MTSPINPYDTCESAAIQETKMSQQYEQKQPKIRRHLQHRICEKNSNSFNLGGLCFNRWKLALNLLSNFYLWTFLCVVENDGAGILVSAVNSSLCNILNKTIRIRGSIAVNPAMLELISYYKTYCPNTFFDVDYNYPVGGKYATQKGFGVSAVCDGNADIGVMERAILPTVDKVTNLSLVDALVTRFECIEGVQPLRQMIQVPILIDAMVVFVGKQSRAWNHCMINKTGGLNRDELRWMFSTETTSFEPRYNQNKSSSSRRWNQLVDTKACQSTIKNNIRIAITNNNVSDKQSWFQHLVFNETLSGLEEDFRTWVGIFNDKSDELRDAVINKTWGVGFCSYSYYKKNMDKIQALAINGFHPDDNTIQNRRYGFFARTIYANFWTQSLDQQVTACFSHYIFTKQAVASISTAGEFVPLSLDLTDVIVNELPDCNSSSTFQPSTEPFTLSPVSPPAITLSPTLSPLSSPVITLPPTPRNLTRTLTDDRLRDIQNEHPPTDGSSITIDVTERLVTPTITNNTNITDGSFFAYNITNINVTLICRIVECIFDGEWLKGNGTFFGSNASLYLHGIRFENAGSPTSVLGGSVVSLANNSNLTIINCIFYNNSAEFGGALYVNGGDVSINNSTFLENTAWRGAAIDIVTGNIEIDSVSFEKNKAIKYGGSICVSCETAIRAKNSVFKDNLSEVFGGAIGITVSGAIVELENVLFQNNSAGSDGAAIYVDTDAELKIKNCSFINNTSSLPLPEDGFNIMNDEDTLYDRIMSRITDLTESRCGNFFEPCKPATPFSAISLKKGNCLLNNVLFSDNKRVTKRDNSTANIFINKKGGFTSCSNVTFCDGLGISDPGKKNNNCRGSNIVKGKSGTPPCPL